MHNKTDESASKFLGKKVSGSESYDPSFLVKVPRYENRAQYNIENKNLPFDGYDVWHAYEFSCLTEKGVPVTRLMKMNYRCDNEFLVESKSLKLYLNSFNMSRFGRNIAECLSICKCMIEKDLSDILETPVKIHFLENNINRIDIFDKFTDLMDYVDENCLSVENFKETPELIEVSKNKTCTEHYLKFYSLRSNCRVTHQPDFGTAFIYYKSSNHIKEDSLVKYLCSFRSEFHFHEECCEMIYKRLYDLLDSGDELFVCILYTRRGGIDICPARWSKNISINPARELIDITKFARCGITQ